MSNNKKIAEIFRRMADLLEIKGTAFKPAAYRKAANSLESLEKDVSEFFEKNNLFQIPGVGKSISSKIEEYLEKGMIKELKKIEEETAIRQIITHFFESKNISLGQLKDNAKKRKIIYSRFTKPAKQLLELAGSTEKAKEAINKVAAWANSRNLDYAIETVFKKWLEIDRLKPKEIVKKPYYMGNPMVWSETKKKWYVITAEGDWLEFADKKEKIDWKIE
jgi:DNA polymerase/3'-5' exonuclease PolX